MATFQDIHIRTNFQPGDIGYITYLHGLMYADEYGYGQAFERYVAEGLADFQRNYDPRTSRIWICEHRGNIIGSLALMHREPWAQLRYFMIMPAYRGIGLGKHLMALFWEFFKTKGYQGAYLWTTADQTTAAKLYRTYGFKLTESKPNNRSFGKTVVEQRYEVSAAEVNYPNGN